MMTVAVPEISVTRPMHRAFGCPVSRVLFMDQTESIEGEYFKIRDCQYIRSRQYMELESCRSSVLRVTWVRYTFNYKGMNYVVLSYLHNQRFEMTVLVDASVDASHSFLRCLTEQEFLNVHDVLSMQEIDFRDRPFV